MDVQFTGIDLGLQELEPTLDGFLSLGWQKRYAHQHQFAATLSPASAAGPVATDVSSHLESIAMVSPDESQLVVIRRDRITASRVKSYTEWQDLWNDLERIFEPYVAGARPKEVRRIAARFINRISPHPSFSKFDDVLERPPQPVLGKGFEEARITNFLRRHVVEHIDGGLTANLTIGTVVAEPGEDTTQVSPLVLDIDVEKQCTLQADLKQLQPYFDQIRKAKNALFFGSLTDLCLEVYE